MAEIQRLPGRTVRAPDITAPAEDPRFVSLLSLVEALRIPVFPCARDGKAPATRNGFKDASADHEQIRRWFEQYPECNWAMPTGPASGIVALDVDIRPEQGKAGDEALRALEQQHGKIPETVQVLTPSGGWHYWLRTLLRLKSGTDKLGPGLDVKADGGYVLIPPSNIGGKLYQFEASSDPAEVHIAELPAWLAQLLAEKPRPAAAAATGAKIPQGARNSTLTSLGGAMRRRGMTEAAISAALLAENAARCNPPLSDADVHRIAQSVAGYDPQAPAQGADRHDPIATDWPSPLDLRELAQREPERPRFIVKDMMPAGYATLFAGHGGLGKSGIALHLAVCIALGLAFFGQSVEQRRALYLSCEDRTNILHWRLARICAYLGINLADLAGHLEILDLVGHDPTLWERDPRSGLSLTPGYWRLVETMERHQTQVLFADGISDTYGGHGGSKHETKRHIDSLVGRVPADTGAVLLVGHIDKKSVREGAKAEGFDSNAGWHNSVRARWYLFPEQQDQDDEHDAPAGALLLDLRKSNLGPLGLQMRFRWDNAAHLFVGELVGGTTILERKIQDRDDLQAIRRAFKACADSGIYVPAASTGQRTAYLVLSQRPEFPTSQKGGGRAKTRRFWAQIEALRQMRHLREGYIRRGNRHKVATLELTTEGCAECA